MRGHVINIHDLYFALADGYRRRVRDARKAGERDKANDYALLAWDAERTACRIRARSSQWPEAVGAAS